MKKFVFLLIINLFLSCSQEHLIFLRNINRVHFLTIDRILDESGLSPVKVLSNVNTNVANSILIDDIALKNISNTNIVNEPLKEEKKVSQKMVARIEKIDKEVTIEPNKEFVINMQSKERFIVFKNSVGNIEYKKGLSNPNQGMFVFQSSDEPSKLFFQIYNLNGELTTNIVYHILITNIVNIITNKPKSLDINTNKNAPLLTNKDSLMMTQSYLWVDSLIKTLRSYNEYEKLSYLKRYINEFAMGSPERNYLIYELSKRNIEKGYFEDFNTYQNELSDLFLKSVLYGLYYKKSNKQTEALKEFVDWLGKYSMGKMELKNQVYNSDNVFKEFLIEMMDYLLDIGRIDDNLLKVIEESIFYYSDDTQFLIEAVIRLSDLYLQNQAVYKSSDLLENLFKKTNDAKVKNKLEELKSYYLQYK